MSDWGKWRALSRRERRVLVHAAMLLVYARVAVRFVALRTESASLPPAARTTGSPLDPETVASLVGAAATRLPFAVTCLHRALVTWWLVRREGADAKLRIGARTDGGFAAHAWVECSGVALRESAARLDAYRPFGVALTPAASAGRRSFPGERSAR